MVMFLLSIDAGLRAKEIASITWEMVSDATGNLTDTIRLEVKVSKGSSGGAVNMSKRLVEALEDPRASAATPRDISALYQPARQPFV
jgi:integrase